jgi:acyl transferase domain-containing protein
MCEDAESIKGRIKMTEDKNATTDLADGIAVTGIALRFPKAESPEQFWENIVTKTDCIDTISIDDAVKAGVPDVVIKEENYIRRAGKIKNPDKFDA